MDINNVGKPFLILDTFKYMKELNLEKTLWLKAMW
jgi:hypothetical protein